MNDAMDAGLECDAVQAVSTPWLDRRLADAAHARVETHLRGCSGCRGEYRVFARLGRLVLRLPRREPDPFAAARALAASRARAAPRPPLARRVALAAAALLLVASGLVGAYELGLRRGRDVAPAAATDHALLCSRAARGVMNDLELLEQVDPPLRRPLLESQLRAFDLPAWAARDADAGDPDGELIALVRQLESALSSGDDARLLRVRDALREIEPRLPAPPAPRGRLEVPRFTRADADAVVDDFAELPTPARAALAELLEAKAAWARGDLPIDDLLRRMTWTRIDGGSFSIGFAFGGTTLPDPPREKKPPR